MVNMICGTYLAFSLRCSTLLVALVVGASGCAPTPAASAASDVISDTGALTTVFEPLAPSGSEGAVFGRLEVFNDGSPVKSGCTARFAGESGSEKAALELDETGWVFTTLRRGLTYLSVTCTIGVSTPSYQSRTHAFEVLGQKKIAYFGHLKIDMHTNPYVKAEDPDGSREVAAGLVRGGTTMLLGGTLGGILGQMATLAAMQGTAGQQGSSSATADVFDRFTDAKFAYETRYGRGASALQPVAVIAGQPINASKFAPATIAGFALGDDIAKAEKVCTGAGHTWQRLDAKKYLKYSCSGPGATLDVPVAVEVEACQDVVCRITLNGNPEGASWETVVPRFVKLAKPLIQVSGKPHDRAVQPLKDCKTKMEIEKCFAAGRARLSLTWGWADGRSAWLTLDGRAAGQPPTLSLVYRTN